MNTTDPAQSSRDDVDLDAVHSAADSDAARKAVNILILTLWRHRVEHAVITDAAGTPRVEVQGETLPDIGWSHISFKDLHLRLSYMGATRPRWLQMLMRSPLPWRWAEFVERRIWLRRQPAGRIDMEINNVPADITFKASDGGRIDMEIREVPPRPKPANSLPPERSDRGRRATGVLVFTLWERHIRHATIVNAPGSVQVKVGDEVLPDEGWSVAPFYDVHRKLSLMTRIEPPRWVRALRQSSLPWRWRDGLEYRFWRPRLSAGEVRTELGGVPAVIRFRAVDNDHIDLEVAKASQPSGPAEGAVANN